MYHLRARQYDPTLGRFTAIDPATVQLTDPYVSSYIYGANQPARFVDPLGLYPTQPNDAPDGTADMDNPVPMPDGESAGYKHLGGNQCPNASSSESPSFLGVDWDEFRRRAAEDAVEFAHGVSSCWEYALASPFVGAGLGSLAGPGGTAAGWEMGMAFGLALPSAGGIAKAGWGTEICP